MLLFNGCSMLGLPLSCVYMQKILPECSWDKQGSSCEYGEESQQSATSE